MLTTEQARDRLHQAAVDLAYAIYTGKSDVGDEYSHVELTYADLVQTEAHDDT